MAIRRPRRRFGLSAATVDSVPGNEGRAPSVAHAVRRLAPVTLCLLAAATCSVHGRPLSAQPPGSPAGARAAALLGDVEREVRHTRYRHATRVDRARGVFEWDCSGMVAWILARSAPRALRGMGRARPVARDFHRVIAAAPRAGSRRGWSRVHVADARAGDVFAWPASQPRPRYTGHVGFLLEAPRAVRDGVWVARIADSTSFPHFADTRTFGGGGFGTGLMSFHEQPDGALSWGWLGPVGPVMHEPVVIGRPR